MPHEGDPCELIWMKISNAKLDDSLDEEERLKEIARAFACGSRPESIPHRRYPDVDHVDVPTPPPFSMNWYRVGYERCANDSDSIFAQAGTADPEAAAEWLAGESAAGDETGQAGLKQGCIDALRGLDPFGTGG